MDLPAAIWRKSTYSGSESDCVEVALTENRQAIRDSKNPDGGMLSVDVTSFTRLVKAGRFDR